MSICCTYAHISLKYAWQVCTTELGEVGKLLPEFAKRGVKVLALSSNTTESHNGCDACVRQLEAVQLSIAVSTPCCKDVHVADGMLQPSCL